MTRPVRKAVFPVGGLGTRFLPATKAIPKEMLPIVDKPLIQYAVEEARAAGIEMVIFVTGRGKAAIEEHFDYAAELDQILRARDKEGMLAGVSTIPGAPGAVAYTRQQEPLGLGHAVWCARHLVGDEPFAVLLADDIIQSATPCLKQMTDAYAQTGGNMVAAMEVPEAHTSRYGIIAPGSQSGQLTQVQGLVEKPPAGTAPSRLAVIGRYILQPEIFTLLEQQSAGAGGEIQLTDAMAQLIGRQPFHGLNFEGTRFDCGDKAGYVTANIAFALARTDVGDPVRAYIDALR